MEALWKVDLDYGTSGATTGSRGPSPYDSISVGSFLLPGDEPPSRNYTSSSPEASPNRRWYLPPNSSDWSAGSSSYAVKYNNVFRTLSIVYSIYNIYIIRPPKVMRTCLLLLHVHCVSTYILYDK